MATLTETIAEGRARVEALRLQPFERTQLTQTLDAIEGVVVPARDLVSECLTALSDPRTGVPTPRDTFVRQRLQAALALLDGTESGS